MRTLEILFGVDSKNQRGYLYRRIEANSGNLYIWIPMTKAEKWEEAILNDSFGATFFSIEFPNKNGYTHAIKELGGEIGVTFSQVSEDKQRFFLDHFEKKFAK